MYLKKFIPLLIALICASKTTSTPPHIIFILADDLVSNKTNQQQPNKILR